MCFIQSQGWFKGFRYQADRCSWVREENNRDEIDGTVSLFDTLSVDETRLTN